MRTDAKEQKLEKFFNIVSEKENFGIQNGNPNESLNEEEFQKQTDKFLDDAKKFEDCLMQPRDEPINKTVVANGMSMK